MDIGDAIPVSRTDLPARTWRKLQRACLVLFVLTLSLDFGPRWISGYAWYCLIPLAGDVGCEVMFVRSVGLDQIVRSWRVGMRGLARYWRDRLGTGPASDGIDKKVWRGVRQIVNAAHADDARKFRRLCLRLGKKLGPAEQQLMGQYVRYMLRYRITDSYGGWPDRAELHAVTVRLAPRFKQLVGYDANALEDALLTVFQMPSPGRAVEGGRLTVHAAAIIGLLLERPEFEMALIRGPLSRWIASPAHPQQQTDPQTSASTPAIRTGADAPGGEHE